ncbi:hypothetical protein Tco_0494679 [Tanacetum coccineum]
MKMEQFQVNTKFLNSLPHEWSKFVTDVKLVKDLHTTNFDQLYVYLEQHDLHANEVHIMRERNQDPLIDSGLAVPMFKQGDYPIDAINKMMSFMSTVVSSRFPTTNNQLINSSNLRQQATIHDGRVTIQLVQGRQNSFATSTSGTRDKVLLVEAQGKGKVLNEEELEFLADPGVAEVSVTQSVITHNATYQADDLYGIDSDCDGRSYNQKLVLMANLSSYGSDVFSEVPYSDNTNNDMLNQSVQKMPYYEQPHPVDYPENEITSDSNIIPYSQYMLETQNAAVQDTNSSAQQDTMILSVFEQLSHQVTNCNKVNKDNLIANETLSAELERYKERFTDFEKEINYLKQTVSEKSKENELLTKTFNVFKNESKEKQARNIDKEIALEKKVKELDNIACKMGQFAQTVHMITKPQVFYDNNLKQALGFQNPFYLKKAQQIRPMLYDGSVIVKETNVISIADSEETLMLEKESRSKMFLKQSDPIVLEKKVNIKSINYAELNRLSKDLVNFLSHNKNCLMNKLSGYKLHTLILTNLLLRLSKLRLLGNFLRWKLLFNNNNTSMNVNSFVTMNDSINYVEMCNKCLELEAELIKQHNMIEKDEYNKLSKRFSELEQHCISFEIVMQLNKEIFQKNNTSVYQTVPSFDQLFELNNLKAELQAKDTTINKLKAHIKRVNKTSTSESVKKDFDEIETINIELEHRVIKLIAENEHLKQTYKQLYDSIKPSRVRAKEHIDSLVNQLNQKKLNGKEIADNVAQMTNATTIAPGMYKLDPIILAPKVKNNREAHEYYLKHTMEQAAILREVVEQAKSRNPLDSASYSACMYVKLIQELLGYVRDTCLDMNKPSEKLVTVTPINKKKTVGFVDIVTSSGNIPKVTNRPLLSSTGVDPSTSASGSKPLGNTKNDRIPRTPSSNEKNKVEVQSRKVKSSLNKRNSNSKNVCNEHVKHPVKGAKALCSICNECLFDANYAMCLIDHVNSMNVRAKSASKKNKKRKEWKPTRKVFNSVGYKWKPTGRTFTLVGNACPLTRLTATNKVPLRVPIPLEVVAPKHVVTRVYTRRPKVPKSVQNSKPKVAKSMTANRMEPDTSRGFDTSVAPSSSSLIDCRLSKLFCGIWTPDAPST